MSTYWIGFWQGVAAAVVAYLALSALTFAWFLRQIRGQDGVEP